MATRSMLSPPLAVSSPNDTTPFSSELPRSTAVERESKELTVTSASASLPKSFPEEGSPF